MARVVVKRGDSLLLNCTRTDAGTAVDLTGYTVSSQLRHPTTDGWLIRPREEAHRLTVTGNLYPYDPGAALFADTLGAYQVQVNLTTSSLTQSVSVDLAAVMDSQGFTQSRAKQLDLIKAILGMV